MQTREINFAINASKSIVAEDTRLNLVVKHDAAVAVRLVAIYVHMWDTKSFFRRVAKNDQDE